MAFEKNNFSLGRLQFNTIPKKRTRIVQKTLNYVFIDSFVNSCTQHNIFENVFLFHVLVH